MLRGLTKNEIEEFFRLFKKATTEVDEFSRAPLKENSTSA